MQVCWTELAEWLGVADERLKQEESVIAMALTQGSRGALKAKASAPPEAVPPTPPPTPPSGDGVMRMDPETLPQRVGETLGLGEDTPKEGVLLALPLGISTVGVGVVCPEKLTRELGV